MTVDGGPRRAARNVELKAVDPDPETSVEACHAIGARDAGLIRQLDTYFNVTNGRLKLREERPGRAHLIQYERPDRPEQRQSSYRIVAVEDPAGLRAALDAALGVMVRVQKTRRLLHWHQVRIHLDEVDGLGRFVELEAVAPPESDLREERRLVAELREALGITDDRLSATGYATQLLRAQRR